MWFDPAATASGISAGRSDHNEKIAFLASRADSAQRAREDLSRRYGDAPLTEAEVIVALGGDGFMLHTLHGTQHLAAPVYGMNRGTVGFLMNEYSPYGLIDRLRQAEEAVINPLSMKAGCRDSTVHEALAINEVSLLREGPQAAKLRITVDGRVRLEELVCDGALVATPAGSTAYNYSAPMARSCRSVPTCWRSPRSPRSGPGAGAGRWFRRRRGCASTCWSRERRPVMAEGDGQAVRDVEWVEIRSEPSIEHRLLFDPGHGLEERLIREQFV